MQYYNPDNFLSNQTSLSSSNELNLQKSTIPNSKLNPQRQTNDKTQLNRLNNNTIANNTTAPNTGASTSTAPGTATGIGIGTGIGTSTGIGTAPSIGSSTTTKPITTGGAGLDLKESSTPQPKKIMTPDTSETKHQMQYCYGDLGASDDKKRFTEINKGIQYGNNGGLDAEDLTAYNGLNVIEKKELLIMTIDIGNGQQDTLYVYEDDDPYHVAKEFCLKHHLDENIIFPLSQNIYNNMEHVLKEKVDLLDQQTQNVAKTNKNILTHETITNGDTLGTISGDIDLDMKQHFDHIKFDDHYQTGSNLIDGNGSGSNTGNGNSNANHSLEAHDGLVDYNSAPVTSSGYNNTKQRKEMSQYQQHQQQQQEEVSTNSREKRGRNRRNLSTDNSFSDINKSMFTGPPLIIMPPKKKSLGNSASKTKTMAFRRRGSKWDNNGKLFKDFWEFLGSF